MLKIFLSALMVAIFITSYILRKIISENARSMLEGVAVGIGLSAFMMALGGV